MINENRKFNLQFAIRKSLIPLMFIYQINMDLNVYLLMIHIAKVKIQVHIQTKQLSEKESYERITPL